MNSNCISHASLSLFVEYLIPQEHFLILFTYFYTYFYLNGIFRAGLLAVMNIFCSAAFLLK